ncbi:hypothetical protein C2I19_11040 [Chromobacterium alticapitis]|uniref:HTH luxR-type domain-containing protein n=2 Tax=Chromobacterium alticapitis TaxID=2073169 RepID=A0A2S5DFN6_9NEIS|nr:hypothetical protein C2I19_11040 [Chromobacterium alticapitis]
MSLQSDAESIVSPLLPRRLKISSTSLAHWAEAMAYLPNEPTLFPIWLEQQLKPLFGFEKLFCVHGEVVAGEVRITHWLSLGYESDSFQSYMQSFEWERRGCLKWWLKNRKPFLLSYASPPIFSSQFELSEMARMGLHTIVGHGLVNPLSREGTYFSMGNVRTPFDPGLLEMMELTMPFLHSQFIDFIHQKSAISLEMDGVPPRQREVLRYALAGYPDKKIAREMDISEKTVRNQLSELYRMFDVRSRAELIVKLR